MSSIELYILCFSFQMCWYFQNQCLFFLICLCRSFFIKINFHLAASLGFCSDGFVNVCLFSHCRIVSIWVFVLWSVYLPYHQSSVLFQINHRCIILIALNVQPNVMFYHFYLCLKIEETEKCFFLLFFSSHWRIQAYSNVIRISNHSNSY